MSCKHAQYILIIISLSNRIFQCLGFISTIHPEVFQKSPITSTALNVLSINVDTVEEFFREAPYVAAFLTCSLKASSADAVAQYYEIKENEELAVLNQENKYNFVPPQEHVFPELFDEESLNKVRRNFAFFLYGGAYQGCVQLFLINTLYPMWFGAGNDVQTVLTKVIFDNFIAAPLLCLPLAYAVKGMILGSTVEDSLKKCWNGFMHEGLMTKYWAVWIPAQCMTFSVIPEHLRIIFIASISFFWLILLSSITCKVNEVVMSQNFGAQQKEL